MIGKLVCIAALLFGDLVNVKALDENLKGQFKLVKLKGNEFEEFRNQHGVHMIYFSKTLGKGGNSRHSAFLGEYEASAKVMTSYNVQLGLVDCESNHIQDFCDRKDVEDFVYAFRDGYELLSLSLDNMFDLNSIVSNILQIVLLREVPIIQTESERRAHEDKHKGTHDLIFTYQVAIGTEAHRVLMEVAYAYGTNYKFGLTTEKGTVQNLPDFSSNDDHAVWLLRCKSFAPKTSDPCTAYKYKDSVTLEALARFLRVIDIPLMHDVAVAGHMNPFRQHGLHTVYVFYDTQSAQQVRDHADMLVSRYMGLFGALLINVDEVEGNAFGLPAGTMVPTVAFLPFTGTTKEELADARMPPDNTGMSLAFMEAGSQDPAAFVHDQLAAWIPTLRGAADTPADLAADLEQGDFDEEEIGDDISLVERQDDQVAEAVTRLSGVPVDRAHLPALTDKTFPQRAASADLLMVIFFLKFDSRSMAFMRHAADASRTLADQALEPLAAVDCYDWTDVCSAQNITAYPSVKLFRRGREARKYREMLSSQAVVDYIHLARAAAPEPLGTASDLEAFLEGERPAGVHRHTSVSVLGLLDDAGDVSAFTKAAETLHGKFMFGLATGELAKTEAERLGCRMPCVMLRKRADPFESQVLFTDKLSTANLLNFVRQKSLSILPELTPSNLPAYLQSGPLVLLFHSEGDARPRQAIGTIALHRRDMRFGALPVGESDSLNYRIWRSYEGVAVLPSLVLLRREQASAHVFPAADLEEAAVERWLDEVMEGALQPTSKLNTRQWKPLNPGFDFLEMIRKEEEQEKMKEKKGRRHHIDIANEQGIGFNEDGISREEITESLDSEDEIREVDHSTPTKNNDDEIRQELLNLRESRLFHQKQGSRKVEMSQTGGKAPHRQHTEL